MSDLEKSEPPRPTSSVSSHLSFSDHGGGDDGGGDADEDNSSLHLLSNNPPSSTCSSSFNLHRQGSNASQQGGQGSSTASGHHLPLHHNLINVVNGSSGGAGILGGSSLANVARTTTISTIAMESNTSPTSKCSPTRLVIALLQTPHQALHLKIIELTPNLLKLPDNFTEAEDYIKNHGQVIKNLQSKQSPVEELLRQADSLIATQKPRAEVYAAMADSLGQTWKDLNSILEERRIVLELAYNCHKVIQSCIDRMNQLHSEYSKFNYIPTVEDTAIQSGQPQDVSASLRKLKEDRADVLKRVSQALDVCQQLLNKITDFNFSIDSRQLFLKRDVDYATKQVHRWLERLHDRRMLLEERLKTKREQFEEMQDFLVYDKEMNELIEEMRRLERQSQEFSLGTNVTTADSQRTELERMVRDMKILQERALLTARKLDQDEHSKGKFYQRSGLKQKIYDILGTVNDLITESIDFELSLVDAKEFFHLAEMANQKLDELAATATTSPEDQQAAAAPSRGNLSKAEINSLTYDALSKGQVLLDSLGWDSPRTKGVRAAYEELSKRKVVIEDELEHLELLDEYNHFLESLNQAYQNILNVETSFIRQPCAMPVDIQSVQQFQHTQDVQMDALSEKTNFQELLQKLDQIYPNLSEEEKLSTEEKVNQLKSLSNLVVELILQRNWIAGEWLKVLQVDQAEWEKISLDNQKKSGNDFEENQKLSKICDNISALYAPIQQQLAEVHRSDPDLDLSRMEARIEEINRKYRQRQNQLATASKIHGICQAYKVKLDHHLLGKPDTGHSTSPSSSLPSSVSAGLLQQQQQQPCYFPVLNDNLVATTLRSEEKTSVALETIIREQLEHKLQNTLSGFFQPLITGYRQEILEAQKDSSGGQISGNGITEKTTEELSWERYFERLKESYVRVTKELEVYLKGLRDTCKRVEEVLGKVAEVGAAGQDSSVETVERIEKELSELTNFRKTYLPGRMEQELKKKLEHVIEIVGHEEPPIQAEQEERTLRGLCTAIIHDRLDGSLSQQQDNLTRQLTEKMIHNDLDMINRTLNELISELEHPCNYGNNLADAQAYLASFERFERTVETLRDKLSRLLTTAGMSETDVKAQNLLGKLNLLVDRKAKRRELILLSLEYFKLIEQSYEHYDKVNREIDEIIAKSKEPEITIETIENLLEKLDTLKTKENEQERRLGEIERISKIIFDVSQEEETRQHYPLRDRSTKFVGDIKRVESELALLLETIKKQIESMAASAAAAAASESVPSSVELELESQIIVKSTSSEKKSTVTMMTEASQAQPPKELVEEKEVVEELIVPTRVVKEEPSFTRPKSQEMCTQTSIVVETQEELDAKTREYLKEKERMTLAVLETLRQSMSPLPPAQLPPQTVEKETQFEEIEEEIRPKEKENRDTLTQTISESVRSFETQTEAVKTMVETSMETDIMKQVDIHLVEQQLLGQQQQQPRRVSKEYLDPMFVQPLKDLVVNEGDKVVLECKTTGRIQKLIWLKDGLEIQNNPDYKTDFVSGSLATLTIDEALPEDSAIFTCRAYGDSEVPNVVETSGRLSIREPVTSLLLPPSFVAHASSSQGEHGKSHVIQVKVEGNPLPTVQWFKDGECIDTSPDYIITFNNGVCQVMFDELVRGMDDGVYICVATNKLGDAETQVELLIKGDVDISKKLSRQPPRITKPLPKNLMSRAGQRVKLECEWESPTDCNIVWIKDDTKILTKSNSSAEITTEDDNRSVLVFNEAYPINSGKYSILVRNCGGETQCDCQIIVKGLLPAETSDSELNVSEDDGIGASGPEIKPCVKMPLMDARARVGEGIRLDCVIIGNPEPEVIWYKNGVPLKEGKNLRLLFHGDKCSAIIEKADLGDNGIYSVSALNNCGEASSKCQVFVVEKTPDEIEEMMPVKAPVFKKIIQDEMVTAGHEFEMKVELEENPGVLTDVTWWKNNSQIKDSYRIQACQIRDEYRLHFKEVDLADKGNYMVKAVNAGGDARCFGCLIVKENFEKAVPEQISTKEIDQPAKPSVQQTPQPSPPSRKASLTGSKTALIKAPRFVIPLEGKMVDEGLQNLSLKCKIDASPPAAVKWTKNNSSDALQPGPDSNLQILYNERNGEAELKFSSVSVKDGGRYTCHASNEHGLASCVSDLIVKKTTFPPVFSKRLQSITVENGKRIYLEVDVFAKPSPQIQWTLNGKPVKASEEEGISFKSDSPTRHALVINSGKKDKFSGEYKVVAKNDAGEAESSCVVNIIDGQGAPPQGDLSVISSARIQHLSKMASSSQPASTTKSEVKVVTSKDEELDPSLVESTTTTTTIITSTEERLYERVTQVISPVPSPDLSSLQVIRQHPKTEVTVPSVPAPTEQLKKDDEGLVPGPEPEILVAPTPQLWSKSSQNQVLEKVKKYEVEGQTMESEGPLGGVRIIPINTPSGKTVTPTAAQVLDFGEPPRIEPILPPTVSPSPLEGYLLAEPPKMTHDVVSSISQDSYTIGGNTQVQERHEEQRSSSSAETRYIKPSKFVPERMRESDHESEVESTIIPPKWIPPAPPVVPPLMTTSAFAPTMIQPPPPIVPLKIPTQQQPPLPVAASAGGGVKSLIKQWPPPSSTFETTTSQQQMSTSSTSMFSSTSSGPQMPASQTTLSPAPPPLGSRLSPIGFAPERARSPTPNKEALEMDKLWARPIRFSSPITVPQSSIPTSSQSPVPPPSQPTRFVTSPTGTLTKKKPEVPPKPSSSSPWGRKTTPIPYSPITSPIPPPSSVSPMMKPEVPPKPSYLKSSPTPYSPLPSPLSFSRPVSATPAPDASALYYVSTVSTPRTTPVPPQLTGWTSPLPTTPEVPQDTSTYASSFHEKRDFFESTTTSYSNFEESSSSTSATRSLMQHPPPPLTDIHPSGISLLDQSFLPPPGEPPVFMYAPPPPKPVIVSTPSKIPTAAIVSSGSTSQQSQSIITSSSSSSTATTSSLSSKVQVMKIQHNQSAATLPRRSQSHRSLLALPSTEPVPKKTALKKPVIMVTDEERHISSSSRTSLLSKESGGLIRPVRRQDAPYIRPTKFVPSPSLFEYFSSSSDREERTSVDIKPKWKPGEEKQQQLSQWRKVTFEVPPGGEAKQKRRDSLSSLVDKNMQEMNKQFKANISHLSQGLCYNHMERKIQSDLGDYSEKGDGDKKGPCPGAEAPGTVVTTTSGDGSVEDANPLIYFKYDFGYEFGIACPRAQSEPPTSHQSTLQLPGGSSRPSSWIEPSDDTPISLPIIHETSKKE